MGYPIGKEYGAIAEYPLYTCRSAQWYLNSGEGLRWLRLRARDDLRSCICTTWLSPFTLRCMLKASKQTHKTKNKLARKQFRDQPSSRIWRHLCPSERGKPHQNCPSPTMRYCTSSPVINLLEWLLGKSFLRNTVHINCQFAVQTNQFLDTLVDRRWRLRLLIRGWNSIFSWLQCQE